MEKQKTELKMIRMSEVESQEVKWLWYPFIPYGKLTIIQGDPGDGKTTLVLNIAAKLSKGECLDGDMDVQEPVNVIYQTAEDGLADTVKPRLEIAGADCEKILVIDEDEETPHLHIDFVPYITGSKRGLDTRVSLKSALAAEGFKGGTRGATELNQWIASEKQELAAVME